MIEGIRIDQRNATLVRVERTEGGKLMVWRPTYAEEITERFYLENFRPLSRYEEGLLAMTNAEAQVAAISDGPPAEPAEEPLEDMQITELERAEVFTQDLMQALATAIDQVIPEGFLFALLLFPSANPGIGNYVSSAARDTMIEALRETATRLENREDNPRFPLPDEAD